ncbi:hypothetical protein [Nonomuraea sp. NPDC050783]|uniref:hypothetical protein n=1 Tax=Nonomuraea sp. NPDC050783 TaxID=3154634 RepID=UPI003464EFD2
MAWFAAGARRLVVRAVSVGALVAAGWLLAVLFGMLTAAPAAADTTAAATGSKAAAAGASAGRDAAAGQGSAGLGSADRGSAGWGSAEPSSAEPGSAEPGSTEPGSQHLSALVGSGGLAASDNAEAMAGRTVAGLNSQQDPGLPSPSTAGTILDGTNGLVPNGGGSGPFGAAVGDVARSPLDPRLQARRAPLAYVLPPVVRTAADDPSFSPD